MLTGTWAKVVGIMFLAEFAYLFVGTMIPVSHSTIQQISNQNSSLASSVASLEFLARAFFIFVNNFRLGAPEVIPFAGWYLLGYSMYNTALALEVVGITQHIPPLLVSFTLIFQPHSWLELPSYAVATTQSFYILSTVARRSSFKFEVVRTGVVLVWVTVELMLAALLESLEVTLISSLTLEFVVPWALFGVLIVLLLIARRRILQDYSGHPSLITNNYCTKCGSRLLEGAIYCDKCGERVSF